MADGGCASVPMHLDSGTGVAEAMALRGAPLALTGGSVVAHLCSLPDWRPRGGGSTDNLTLGTSIAAVGGEMYVRSRIRVVAAGLNRWELDVITRIGSLKSLGPR